jgi:hypothetical protein
VHRFWQEKCRLSRGAASKKGAERTNQKGRATERCGFFLCFERFGRYNGYRWPYSPFNAQTSIGNVRLFAVES